jgi:hypothetical protein
MLFSNSLGMMTFVMGGLDVRLQGHDTEAAEHRPVRRDQASFARADFKIDAVQVAADVLLGGEQAKRGDNPGVHDGFNFHAGFLLGWLVGRLGGWLVSRQAMLPDNSAWHGDGGLAAMLG